MVPPSSLPYAGDISAAEAWDRLATDPNVQLVDVRTVAEWNFVGIPDLTDLGREAFLVEWQGFPGGQRNGGFLDQVAAAVPDKTAPLLLLCRSGARSRSAAIALTQAGFAAAFNVAGGFEGDADQDGHRGTVNGWKAAGLPWRQG